MKKANELSEVISFKLSRKHAVQCSCIECIEIVIFCLCVLCEESIAANNQPLCDGGCIYADIIA